MPPGKPLATAKNDANQTQWDSGQSDPDETPDFQSPAPTPYSTNRPGMVFSPSSV